VDASSSGRLVEGGDSKVKGPHIVAIDVIEVIPPSPEFAGVYAPA
jgi:hypothetical protein